MKNTFKFKDHVFHFLCRPTIVNGHVLTPEQAMTARVAVESFAAMLAEGGALGSGNSAEALREFYKTQLAGIQLALYE